MTSASSDTPTAAGALLDAANSRPDWVLATGRDVIEELDTDLERSIAWRAMSVAARILGDGEGALEFADLAEAAARDAGSDEQQLLARLTRTGPMIVGGQLEEALDLIESSEALATTPYLVARCSYQRAVVHMFRGEDEMAVAAFDSSLPAFRAAHDSLMVRSALQNLARLRIVAGRLDEAEGNLSEALEIAAGLQQLPAISGINHHLGLLASYRGDIPEALRRLQVSDDIYMEITGAPAPQHVARCDVLMSAGLFQEAFDLASSIARHHRDAGDSEHLVDALLVAGRAALYSNELAMARAYADEAGSQARNHGWRMREVEAIRFSLEARYRAGDASKPVLEQAVEVAADLDEAHQLVASAEAHLLAGEVAIDLGDDEEAKRQLRRVSEVSGGPVETRVHAHLARALIRLLDADRRGAAAAARSGLRLIDEYQRALVATDLRFGLERHATRLASIGLGLALESRRPRRILRWMEHTRARALRHAPVVPSGNDELEPYLTRLRQIEAELRETDRRADLDLQAERRRLQDHVRSAERTRTSRARPTREFSISWLDDALGDMTLAEIAEHEGRLTAVVLSQGTARRFEVGDAEPVKRELAHVRFSLRRSARLGRAVSPGLLDSLDEKLLSGLPLEAPDVVLVPPPALMSVPWAALPSLRSRSLVVSPSAEMWWHSRNARSRDGRVAVVGGPDLAVAEAEIELVAGLYDEPVVLPPQSSVERVASALGGASVAHVACHAVFQVENPMFTSLRLGDGDLSVYDLERIEAPGLVVLSACDSGYTETLAGDELAGLTSALLSMGTRTVVASVGLVPDSSATSELMVDFHSGLVEGLEPARALARAQSAAFADPTRFVSAASFICVGA